MLLLCCCEDCKLKRVTMDKVNLAVAEEGKKKTPRDLISCISKSYFLVAYHYV